MEQQQLTGWQGYYAKKYGDEGRYSLVCLVESQGIFSTWAIKSTGKEEKVLLLYRHEKEEPIVLGSLKRIGSGTFIYEVPLPKKLTASLPPEEERGELLGYLEYPSEIMISFRSPNSKEFGVTGSIYRLSQREKKIVDPLFRRIHYKQEYTWTREKILVQYKITYHDLVPLYERDWETWLWEYEAWERKKEREKLMELGRKAVLELRALGLLTEEEQIRVLQNSELLEKIGEQEKEVEGMRREEQLTEEKKQWGEVLESEKEEGWEDKEEEIGGFVLFPYFRLKMPKYGQMYSIKMALLGELPPPGVMRVWLPRV